MKNSNKQDAPRDPQDVANSQDNATDNENAQAPQYKKQTLASQDAYKLNLSDLLKEKAQLLQNPKTKAATDAPSTDYCTQVQSKSGLHEGLAYIQKDPQYVDLSGQKKQNIARTASEPGNIKSNSKGFARSNSGETYSQSGRIPNATDDSAPNSIRKNFAADVQSKDSRINNLNMDIWQENNIQQEADQSKQQAKELGSSGNFQEYLFEQNKMREQIAEQQIMGKEQSFEQLAGQSVNDISPSPVPNIQALDAMDKVDGIKDYQVPQNRESRGIFSLFNGGKSKQNQEDDEFYEEQADEERMEVQKFSHLQNNDLGGLVDQESEQNLTGDMTYENHQLQFKQMFASDVVTVPNQPQQTQNQMNQENFNNNCQKGVKSQNKDQKQSNIPGAANNMTSYEQELIDQHQNQNQNQSKNQNNEASANRAIIEDDDKKQGTPYLHQQSANSHQFSFKDDITQNTDSQDRRVGRIMIDNLIEEVKGEQYQQTDADHHKFEFKNQAIQEDSPSQDSTFEVRDPRQQQVNQVSTFKHSKDNQEAEEAEDAEEASDVNQQRGDFQANLQTPNVNEIGGVVSININNSKPEKQVTQNQRYQQQSNSLVDHQDQNSERTQTPLSQNTRNFNNNFAPAASGAASSIHQPAQNQCEQNDQEVPAADQEILSASQSAQIHECQQRSENNTREFSNCNNNQGGAKRYQHANNYGRRRSQYHHGVGAIRDPDYYEGVGEDELCGYGEDDDILGPHKEGSGEDTDIDFIQQVDTDRSPIDHNATNTYLPVNNENQIEIISKQQADIYKEGPQCKNELETKQAKPNQNLQQNPRQAQIAGNSSISAQKLSAKKEPNTSLQMRTQQSGTGGVNSVQSKQSKQMSQKKLNDKDDLLSSDDKINSVKETGSKKLKDSELSYTEVYVWGDDTYGQLGLQLQTQNKDISQSPLNFYAVPKSCSFNVLIKEISCGQFHSAMLTVSGFLYMMGSNEYGQLGVGIIQSGDSSHAASVQMSEDFQGTFRKQDGGIQQRMNDRHEMQCIRAPCLVDSLKKIRIQKVECGSNFTFAVVQGGQQVYAWGYNNYGQLGLGQSKKINNHSSNHQRKEQQSFSEKIQESKYQNINSKLCIDKPQRVLNFPNNKEILSEISCGENHTLFKTYISSGIGNKALSPKNQATIAYSCGLNNFNQCGFSKNYEQINQPTKIIIPKSLTNIAQIKAFQNQSLFLCEKTGFVYKCGEGSSKVDGEKRLFQQIVIQDPIKSINASALGCIALSFSGALYVWEATLKPQQVPQDFFGGSLKDISLANNFAVAINSNKEQTFVWGDINQGDQQVTIKELLQQGKKSVHLVKAKFIKTVKCGNNFVFAMGRDVQANKQSKHKNKHQSKKHNDKMNDVQIKSDDVDQVQNHNQINFYPSEANPTDPDEFNNQYSIPLQYAQQPMAVNQPGMAIENLGQQSQFPQNQYFANDLQSFNYNNQGMIPYQHQEYLVSQAPLVNLYPQAAPQMITAFGQNQNIPHYDNINQISYQGYIDQQMIIPPYNAHPMQLFQSGQPIKQAEQPALIQNPAQIATNAGARSHSQGGSKKRVSYASSSKQTLAKSRSKPTVPGAKALSTSRSLAANPQHNHNQNSRFSSNANLENKASLARRKDSKQPTDKSQPSLHHPKGVMACNRANAKKQSSNQIVQQPKNGLPPQRSLNALEYGYVDMNNSKNHMLMNNNQTKQTTDYNQQMDDIGMRMNFANQQINGILNKQEQQQQPQIALPLPQLTHLMSEPDILQQPKACVNPGLNSGRANTNSQKVIKPAKKSQAKGSTSQAYHQLPSKKLIQGKRSQSHNKSTSRNMSKPKATKKYPAQKIQKQQKTSIEANVRPQDKSIISNKSIKSALSNPSGAFSDKSRRSHISAYSQQSIRSNLSQRLQRKERPKSSMNDVTPKSVRTINSDGRPRSGIKSYVPLRQPGQSERSASVISGTTSRVSRNSLKKSRSLSQRSANRKQAVQVINERQAETKFENHDIKSGSYEVGATKEAYMPESNISTQRLPEADAEQHAQIMPSKPSGSKSVKSNNPYSSRQNHSRHSSVQHRQKRGDNQENINQINRTSKGRSDAKNPKMTVQDVDENQKVREWKLKVKSQKNEIKILIDENIQKDNNIQRLIHQVERYKRGLPYSFDGSNGAAMSPKAQNSLLGDTMSNILQIQSNRRERDKSSKRNEELIQSQKQQIKQLKQKVKKQNTTIKSLNEKVANVNEQLMKVPKKEVSPKQSAPQLQPSTSQDLFIATEQNCNLEEKVTFMDSLIRKQDEVINQQTKEIFELRDAVEESDDRLTKKERQLKEATQELDQLQQGIRDFQDQTHQIQNELIQKIQQIQSKYEKQSIVNTTLRCELEKANEALNSTNYETAKMNDLLAANLRKDSDIVELQRENKAILSELRELKMKNAKSDYGELVNRIGVPRREQKSYDAYSQKSLKSKKSLSPDKSKNTGARRGKSYEPGTAKYSNDNQSPAKISRTSKFSNYNNETQNPPVLGSKRSFERFDPKADLKDMISEKLRSRKEETAQKSQERSYERYKPHLQNGSFEKCPPSTQNNTMANLNLKDMYSPIRDDTEQTSFNIQRVDTLGTIPADNKGQGFSAKRPSIPRKEVQYQPPPAFDPHYQQENPRMSYHGKVDNPQNHSYLSRMGEMNRYARDALNLNEEIKDSSGSPQKAYFNQKHSQPEKRGSVPATSANAYHNQSEKKSQNSSNQQQSPTKSQRSGEKSGGSGPRSEQIDQQKKEQSIRELRDRYNQLMKQSLERKATQRQRMLVKQNPNHVQ